MAGELNTYQNLKGSFGDALKDVMGIPKAIEGGLWNISSALDGGGAGLPNAPANAMPRWVAPNDSSMQLARDPKSKKLGVVGDVRGTVTGLENYLPKEQMMSMTQSAEAGRREQANKEGLQMLADSQYALSDAGKAENAAMKKQFKASQNEQALAAGRAPYDYSGLAYAGSPTSGGGTPPTPVYTPPTYGGTQPTTPAPATPTAPASGLPVANVGGLKSTDYAGAKDFKNALMAAQPNSTATLGIKKTQGLQQQAAGMGGGLLDALSQIHDAGTKSIAEYAPGLAAKKPADLGKYEIPTLDSSSKQDITGFYGIKPRTMAQRGMKV